MKRALLSMGALGVACAAISAASAPACNDVVAHVYAARQLEAARACLDPTASVDVVDGDDPGSSCAPTCLVAVASPSADAGAPAVYVSTMCPPYPPQLDVTGASPLCAVALAAFARHDQCLGDGGSTSPAPLDASADGSVGDSGISLDSSLPEAGDEAGGDL